MQGQGATQTTAGAGDQYTLLRKLLFSQYVLQKGGAYRQAPSGATCNAMIIERALAIFDNNQAGVYLALSLYLTSLRMPAIYLIRHGQASFGARNYDELSELGHRQSALLGEHFNACGLKFDAMVTGAMARQRATAESARKQMEADLPELTEQPAFNEYDADGLFRAYLPRAFMEDAELKSRRDEIFKDRGLFQRAFARVTECWLADQDHNLDDLETWSEFCARVEAGLQALHDANDRKAKIAVFTSGGAIAVSLRAALSLSDKQTVRVNWRVKNASVSEIRYGSKGASIASFNNIAHLELARNPELITYR